MEGKINSTNFFERIDTDEFVKQKDYIVSLLFEAQILETNINDESLQGILNLLDSIQDICEDEYGMEFNFDDVAEESNEQED